MPSKMAGGCSKYVIAAQRWVLQGTRAGLVAAGPAPGCAVIYTNGARVDYAVDAALSRGMRIVIDMHHYHQLDGDALETGEFSVDPTVMDERFVAIWRQIATRYRDRPTTVLYELYNEPHGLLNAAGWNALLSLTLDAVRAIDTLA